jgi:hypothetical protein
MTFEGLPSLVILTFLNTRQDFCLQAQLVDEEPIFARTVVNTDSAVLHFCVFTFFQFSCSLTDQVLCFVIQVNTEMQSFLAISFGRKILSSICHDYKVQFFLN